MSSTLTSKKENKTRVWTAVDRNRLKNIAFKVGSGSKRTYLELAQEIESKYDINYMYTDEYDAYGYYRIANYHITTKSKTCLVESFNSSLRDMLARFNRRTKRFSKCAEMLRLTVLMFYNEDLSMSIYL